MNYSNQEIFQILNETEMYCCNPLITENTTNIIIPNEEKYYDIKTKNIRLIKNLLDAYFKQIKKMKENYQQYINDIASNKKSSFDYEECLTQINELKKLIIANV